MNGPCKESGACIGDNVDCIRGTCRCDMTHYLRNDTCGNALSELLSCIVCQQIFLKVMKF